MVPAQRSRFCSIPCIIMYYSPHVGVNTFLEFIRPGWIFLLKTLLAALRFVW